jgi:hypothetical protein
MSTLDLQNAIGDTLLQVVLQQQAQAKKFRQQRDEQADISRLASVGSSISSKVYAKAA